MGWQHLLGGWALNICKTLGGDIISLMATIERDFGSLPTHVLEELDGFSLDQVKEGLVDRGLGSGVLEMLRERRSGFL